MRNERGYVLLVVIAVSVVAITVLSSLAKISLRRGLEAADARRSLQKRWGTITLERSLLPLAQRLFQEQADRYESAQQGTPPTTIRTAITLGEVTFDVMLGDEDAKLNVNTLYHHAGERETQATLSRMVGTGPGTLRLIPAVPSQRSSASRSTRSLAANDTDDEGDEDTALRGAPPAFQSWGEVFHLPALHGMSARHGTGGGANGSAVVLPNLTTGITCWGNGQLNVRRATDDAILAVAGAVLQKGGGQRFLKRFRANPEMTLEVLLLSEVSNRKNRRALKQQMSETSTNFSMWLNASSETGRDQRQFMVTMRDDEGSVVQSKFSL